MSLLEYADMKTNLLTSILVASVLLVGARSAWPVEPFILAKPGVKTAIIVTANPPKYVFPYWGGYRILQRYLRLVTGVDVPIVKDSQLKDKDLAATFDYRIWVGRQERVEQALGEDLRKIDDDGFIIRVVGRDLYLAGKFRWGDHWAAHDVLERFAGCRWYMDTWQRWWQPKEDGVRWLGHLIPKAKSVELPGDTDIVEEPAYKSRWFRPLDVHAFRLRYRDKFHHALRGVIPPSKHYAEHPEWYPEIKGKRYQPRDDNDFQPCVSNAKLKAFVAERIVAFFDARPETSAYSLGMNDSNRFCECGACQAVAPASIQDKRARIAYAFFRFYNDIAEQVSTQHPDKRLGCLAYAGLRALPPGAIKLHPLVVPYLTLDSAQLFDEAQQKEFYRDAGKWRSMASRMGIYEYLYGGGFVIPRIYNRYIVKNLRERYTVGVDAFYGEAYPSWGLDGPKYWLISKLLWDNTLDPEALLEEYYGNMFGEAAPEMRRYFEFLEETWCTQTLKSNRSNYRWLRDVRQLEIFPPAKCDEAMAFLREAEGRTDDPAVLERIAFFRDSFAFTRTLSYRYHARQRLDVLADDEELDFAEALKALEVWAAGGAFSDAYERVKALKAAIYLGSYREVSRQFDPVPVKALNRMVDRLVTRAVGAAKERTPESIRAETDRALESEAAKLPTGAVEHAVEFLGKLARERGFIFIRGAEEPPAIDGTVGREEWGDPAFDGRFHRSRRVRDLVSHKTAVWAVRRDRILYLAFRCEADPRLMHVDLEGVNPEKTIYPKMRFDDAISICFPAPRPGIRPATLRFNAKGALQFSPWKRLDVKLKAQQTKAGWEAELSLPLPGQISDQLIREGLPVRMPIARYYAAEAADRRGKKLQRGLCSSIYPVGVPGRIIWRGDHENCMTFLSGPRVVYEKAPAPED